MKRFLLAAAFTLSLPASVFAANTALFLPNTSPSALSTAQLWAPSLLAVGRQAKSQGAPQGFWWLVKNMLNGASPQVSAALVAPWAQALESRLSPKELKALKSDIANMPSLSPARREQVYAQLSQARERAKSSVSAGIDQLKTRLFADPGQDLASLKERAKELGQADELVTRLSLYSDNGIDASYHSLIQEFRLKHDETVLRLQRAQLDGIAQALLPKDPSSQEVADAPAQELGALSSPKIDMYRDGGSMTLSGDLNGNTITVVYDGGLESPTRGKIMVNDRGITRTELVSLKTALPAWAVLNPRDRALYEAFSNRVARALKRGREDFSRFMPSHIEKERGGFYTITGTLDGEDARIVYNPWFANQAQDQTSVSIDDDAERMLSANELEALKQALQRRIQSESDAEQREYYGYVLAARA